MTETMKQIFTILILVLTCGLQNVKGQQSEITKTFDKYIEATKSENIEEQLDYYHPEIFKHLPRDTFLLAFKMLKSNPMIQVGNEKLVSVSEIYTENKSSYALLTFTQEISMDMSNMKDEGGASTAISFMLIELNKEHGEDNVIFNEDKYIVKISMTNEFYTILEPTLKEWKFLPKEDDTQIIIEQIIPKRIIKKI